MLNEIVSNKEHELKTEDRGTAIISGPGIISGRTAMEQLHQYMLEGKRKCHIETGINELDRITGGGLEGGLILLAGMASMGKTLIAVHIAVHAALKGVPVLYYTMEQRSDELLAKCISAFSTQQLQPEQYGSLGITRKEILDGGYMQASDAKRKVIEDVWKKADACLIDKITVIDANMSETRISCDMIREHVRLYHAYGMTPFVVVDYLQLLEIGGDKYITDITQRVGAIGHTLKCIGNTYDTPIFALSDMARSEYYKAISDKSSKNSGDLEYAAHMVLGLQPRNAEKLKEKDYSNVKKQTVRDMEMPVIKYKNGGWENVISFTMYTEFNQIVEKNPGKVSKDVPGTDKKSRNELKPDRTQFI